MQHAKQAEFSPFNAGNWKMGIVVAQFNRHITDKLLESVLSRAAEYQIKPDNIELVKVAGVVEIPLVLQQLAHTRQYQALLAIGCVIRGATPHFDYVASFVTDGVLRVQLDNNIPIGFGVLTCDTEAQAAERSNLGGDHLDAVLQQARALRDINAA